MNNMKKSHQQLMDYADGKKESRVRANGWRGEKTKEKNSNKIIKMEYISHLDKYQYIQD